MLNSENPLNTQWVLNNVMVLKYVACYITPIGFSNYKTKLKLGYKYGQVQEGIYYILHAISRSLSTSPTHDYVFLFLSNYDVLKFLKTEQQFHN